MATVSVSIVLSMFTSEGGSVRSGEKHKGVATLGELIGQSRTHMLGQGLASEVYRHGAVQETLFRASYAREPGPPGGNGDARLFSW